jgi:uncharacterized membrane-anchored protein YitT (DUF2179 family)
MEGIEILSSEIIYNTILPEWCLALGLCLAITFVIVTTWAFLEAKYNLALLFLIMIVVSIVIACLGDTKSKTYISHIEYKVTIDNSVLMNEFLDKYEILDQEGKIYTITEKEN